jgi:plasmid maintenance system antidote protein VapI
MNSIVTQRFIHCHHQLKQDNRVRSSRQFAIALDYLPQSLSEILKGRRDVTIDLLRRAVEVYQINPLFLYTGEGDMFLQPQRENTPGALANASDAKNREQILHIPINALDGYPHQMSDPRFVETLPIYSLPELRQRSGLHRLFDVNGDSMHPTFVEGEKLISSFIEPDQWEIGIKNLHVYVVVSTKEVAVKRIVNGLKENQHLQLISDNSFYESYPLYLKDIKEIWQVHTRICPFLSSVQHPRFSMQEEIKDLKQMIGEQQQMIQRLQNTIENSSNLNHAQ